ncbi:hypothetical protein Pyn_17489 [Prunus yedoensis var. nudiflora]|uniref:Uncharacterized protein n=1 Tax=Prunus yedoensis var. nudiflora TaxID=2094558 RepID=A0A314UQG6_PRUYE|nr:hypothetical protein Pyn_17489 [Prunus yedoensis var. nudiflora]
MDPLLFNRLILIAYMQLGSSRRKSHLEVKLLCLVKPERLCLFVTCILIGPQGETEMVALVSLSWFLDASYNVKFYLAYIVHWTVLTTLINNNAMPTPFLAERKERMSQP